MQGQLQLVLEESLPEQKKKTSERSSKRKLQDLPPIPDKLYFSISEAGGLCLVKPHVLRYWEQEFPQLAPNKRRGQRRFYQRHDILLIRRIKKLLYEDGFTIEGARAKLKEKKKACSDKAEEVSSSSPNFIQDIISGLKGIIADLDRS